MNNSGGKIDNATGNWERTIALSEQVRINEAVSVDLELLVQEIFDFVAWAVNNDDYIALMNEQIALIDAGDDENARDVKIAMNSICSQYRKDNGLHFSKDHFLILGTTFLIYPLCRGKIKKIETEGNRAKIMEVIKQRLARIKFN